MPKDEKPTEGQQGESGKKGTQGEEGTELTQEELQASQTEIVTRLFPTVPLARQRAEEKAEEKSEEEDTKSEEEEEDKQTEETEEEKDEVQEDEEETDDAQSEEEETEEVKGEQEKKQASQKKAKKPVKASDVPPPPEQLFGQPAEEKTTQTTETTSTSQKAEYASTFSEDDQLMLDAMKKLEKERGGNWAGLADKVVDFWKREQLYIANWQKENPGMQFSNTDEEHSEFYATAPSYDEKAVDRAMARVEIERSSKPKEDEETKKLKDEVKVLRREQKIREALPKIAESTGSALIAFMGQSVPEFGEILKKQKTSRLDKKTMDALAEADPVAFSVVGEHGEILHWMLSELETMAQLGEDYDPNATKPVRLRNTPGAPTFYIQDELRQYIGGLDRHLAGLPPTETLMEGKRYITNQQYIQLRQSILNGRGTQESKEAKLDQLSRSYYTLTPELIRNYLIAGYSAAANQQLAKLKGMISKGSKKSSKSKSDTASMETQSDEEKTQESQTSTRRTKAPSTSSESETSDTKEKATKPTAISEQQIAKKLWGL